MKEIKGIKVSCEKVEKIEFIIINIKEYTKEVEDMIMKDLLRITDGINSFSTKEDIKRKMNRFNFSCS